MDIPFATGGQRSPRDYRDVPLKVVPTYYGQLPPSTHKGPGVNILDVSQLPVWMQARRGACVGHAGAKYLQKRLLTTTGQLVPLSARFAYDWAKTQDGTQPDNAPQLDGGTYPRIVAKGFKTVGCATEATVPNDTSLDPIPYTYGGILANFPAGSLDDAAPFKIPGYAFPNMSTPDDLTRSVDEFEGSMLLLELGKEWYTAPDGTVSWDAKDIVPLRAPQEIISGHEIYTYGYVYVTPEDKVNLKEHSVDLETLAEQYANASELDPARTELIFCIFNSWDDSWALSGKNYFFWSEYGSNAVEAITFVELPQSIAITLSKLPTAETFSYKFNNNLIPTQRGADVVALQTALMIDGEFGEGLYITLLQENELGYFGDATTQALENFQKRYKISTVGVPEAGPLTRQKLNDLFSK